MCVVGRAFAKPELGVLLAKPELGDTALRTMFGLRKKLGALLTVLSVLTVGLWDVGEGDGVLASINTLLCVQPGPLGMRSRPSSDDSLARSQQYRSREGVPQGVCLCRVATV